MRPRRSLTGPLILILIGVAFLTRNLWQEVPLFQLVAQYWPFLLIAWGVLRLLEVLLEAARSKPLPSGGLSGGEIALIILLCIIGSGMYAADRHGVHFAPFGTTSLEMFGEEYDYRTSAQKATKGPVHVVFENLRGNVRVTGSGEAEIKVDEHKMIRAFNKNDADQADKQSPIEIVTDGDRIVVRTNEEKVSHARRISCEPLGSRRLLRMRQVWGTARAESECLGSASRPAGMGARARPTCAGRLSRRSGDAFGSTTWQIAPGIGRASKLRARKQSFDSKCVAFRRSGGRSGSDSARSLLPKSHCG